MEVLEGSPHPLRHGIRRIDLPLQRNAHRLELSAVVALQDACDQVRDRMIAEIRGEIRNPQPLMTIALSPPQRRRRGKLLGAIQACALQLILGRLRHPQERMRCARTLACADGLRHPSRALRPLRPIAQACPGEQQMTQRMAEPRRFGEQLLIGCGRVCVTLQHAQHRAPNIQRIVQIRPDAQRLLTMPEGFLELAAIQANIGEGCSTPLQMPDAG